MFYVIFIILQMIQSTSERTIELKALKLQSVKKNLSK